MRDRGFTLIEIIVVMGVVGVLITASVYVLSGAFLSKTRSESADTVERNGSLILDQLRQIGLDAMSHQITCPVSGVGSSLSLTSARDGGITVLSCVNDDTIASSSANGTMELVVSGIRLSGCNTFVSCDTIPSVGVSALNFDFKLSLGNSGFGAGLVERDFRSRVVVRN